MQAVAALEPSREHMIVIYSTQPDALLRKTIAMCLMAHRSFIIQTCSEPLAIELLDGAKEAQLFHIPMLQLDAVPLNSTHATTSHRSNSLTIDELARKLQQLASEGILRKPRYLQKLDWPSIYALTETCNNAWEEGQDLGDIQSVLLKSDDPAIHQFIYPDRKQVIKQVLECLSTAEALYHVCCSTLSMETIALRCKFRRLSHFSRVFTEHNSIPPTAIRQKIHAARHQIAS